MRLYKPHELLEELGITEPDEIDLEAIAAHVGATVIAEALAGVEATLVGAGERAIITVSASSSAPRQRFSIGHELGHWMHDRGRAQFSCSERAQNGSFLSSDPESLANRYATELLLPEYMVKPRLAKQPLTLNTVQALAATFNVSMTATALRVVELGMWPAMAVCYSKDKRLWFKRGHEVPNKIWPVRALSEDSIAFDLLTDAGSMSGSDEVDADAWIDSPDAGDYSVVESSFKVTRDLVVSLIWWKDQAQLVALEED
jgi:Zn-dependent peptidase ImmA (M78 family)